MECIYLSVWCMGFNNIMHVSPIAYVLASIYILTFPNLEWTNSFQLWFRWSSLAIQTGRAVKQKRPNEVIKGRLPQWNIFIKCDVWIQMSCHHSYCYFCTLREYPKSIYVFCILFRIPRAATYFPRVVSTYQMLHCDSLLLLFFKAPQFVCNIFNFILNLGKDRNKYF